MAYTFLACGCKRVINNASLNYNISPDSDSVSTIRVVYVYKFVNPLLASKHRDTLSLLLKY